MICPNCQVELPSEARFCMNCGQPLQASAPGAAAHLTRVASVAPAPLVEKARASNRLSGEQRTVTALFVDVVGSLGLAARLGPQITDELIAGLWDLTCPMVYRYEGTVAQLHGDELLVFFGAPVAHEDDPVRAVHAALELLEAVQEYRSHILEKHGVDFSVRMGLSTGPVVVGSVGDDMKYEYSALGGTLNLAAHLRAARLPMTALATEHTYRFIKPFFDCTDLGEISAGLITLRIYRVDGVRSAPGPARGLAGLQSAMVGREKELAALTQQFRLVQAGVGRAALVLGEPGIGKTRLIAEWKKVAEMLPASRTVKWAQGRCLSYSQEQPYFLARSLLRALVGVPEMAEEPETRAALSALVEKFHPVEDEDYLEIFPYLAHLLDLKISGAAYERVAHLDPQAHQARAQTALQRLLAAITAQNPLVLILEDLHWADPSSVELLGAQLALSNTHPLLFCLVMRPEREIRERDIPGWRLAVQAREVLGGRLVELPLESLSEADSRKLVSNLLEIEALPDKVRDLILQKAEGNPFFVEEVIRMLIDREVILYQDGRWRSQAGIDQVDIPDNLHGLLLARIDRLPEDARQILRIAAVIGRQFPVKVLEYVLGKEFVQ